MNLLGTSMTGSTNKSISLLEWGLLILAILLTLNISYNNVVRFYLIKEYMIPLKADKIGYTVYLPATLLYDWDGTQMPNQIEKEVGMGFDIDRQTGRIDTKYPYGVALLQSPFYVWGLIQNGSDSNGFEERVLSITHLAGGYYGILGVFLLYLTIRDFTSRWRSFILSLFAWLGTSLWYYTTIEASMSHAYSFFAVSGALFTAHRFIQNPKWKWFLALSISFGLIVIIRPFNLILLAPISLWIIRFERAWTWISYKRYLPILIMLGIGIALVIPQLAYYQYNYGSPFKYSYGDEGFNFLNPEILLQWFSPQTSLLFYTPLLLLGVLSLPFALFKRSEMNASLQKWNVPALVILAFVIYLDSTWYYPQFGCAFGMRPYTDFVPLLALTILPMIDRMSTRAFTTLTIVGIVACTFTVFLSRYYTGCSFFEEWDFAGYYHLLEDGYIRLLE